MPNVGKRSTGCVSCRRMKVKCDEVKPVCVRCARASRSCVYSQVPSIFRSMNDTSEHKALNPRPRARGKKSCSRAGDDNEASASGSLTTSRRHSAFETTERDASGVAAWTATSNTFSALDELSARHSTQGLPMRQGKTRSHSTISLHSPNYRSTPLTRPLATDWPAQAICYYLSEWTAQPDDLHNTAGHLEFLPEMMTEAREGSYLLEAVGAVSLMAMATRCGMGRLGVEARRAYGRALSGVNTALNDPVEAKGDPALLCLVLLGQFEIISANKPWISHATGQRALIELRGEAQFETERGRGLFRISQASMQVVEIGRGTFPSYKFDSWQSKVFVSPHGQKMIDLTTRVISMQANSKVLLEITPWPDRDANWVRDIFLCIEEGVLLLAEIETWEVWAPGEWRYETAAGFDSLTLSDSEDEMPGSLFSSPGVGFSRSLPQRCFVFHNLTNASIWAMLWRTQLRLLDILLALREGMENAAILNLVPRDSHGLDKTTLLVKLTETVQKIISTVPTLMGEIDYQGRLVMGGHGKSLGGVLALSAIFTVGTIVDTNDEVIDWVRDCLARISNQFGIRQAGEMMKIRVDLVAKRRRKKAEEQQWISDFLAVRGNQL